MTFLLALASGVLFILLLTLLSNLLLFPRLSRNPLLKSKPFVSILVPARNEAGVIGQTVTSILGQPYPNFELLVLDDASTDDTGQIALKHGNGDHRLQVLPGHPLPKGWAGKNWACHTLSKQARGEILIFTDADVRWQPRALESLLQQFEESNADLVTVWPTQQTITWSERLTIPLMAMVIMSYLPVVMVHQSPYAIFAAANGQCMAWRRSAYEQIRGHSSIAGSVLDDVLLARAAKRSGQRMLMVDGNQMISCRMYDSWSAVLNGYAKNMLAGYGNSIVGLAAATVFHWVVFLLPWLALAHTSLASWALALICAGMLLRAVSARFTHQRVLDALWMPVSVLLMTRIAIQSAYWHYTGGPRWKGRTLGSIMERNEH